MQPESTETEQHPLQTVQKKVWTFQLAVFCHSLGGFCPSLLDFLALEIHPPEVENISLIIGVFTYDGISIHSKTSMFTDCQNLSQLSGTYQNKYLITEF